MKEYLCEVVPVYVRPKPIVDEKACVGVIVRCSEADFFDWRLVGRTAPSLDRIANFFPHFGRENLVRALAWAESDIGYSCAGSSKEIVEKRFANLVRPRENVIQYGSPQVCVTQSPQDEIERIYQTLVA